MHTHTHTNTHTRARTHTHRQTRTHTHSTHTHTAHTHSTHTHTAHTHTHHRTTHAHTHTHTQHTHTHKAHTHTHHTTQHTQHTQHTHTHNTRTRTHAHIHTHTTHSTHTHTHTQAEYERCESSSTPDGSKVLVRLRGLPWGVTVEDLAGFFSGHTLVSTAILTRSGGRQQTGEAYVELDSEAAASAAMVLHRKELRGRYIELFLATKGEMLAVVAATDGPPPGTPGGAGSEEERRVVKVRGIPWASTAADVAGFFLGLQLAGGQADGTGAHPAVVMIPGADGRASGEALVAFADAVAATAALKRDKHQLGNRWVDVMPVTAAEMRARAGGGGDPGRGPPWLEPTWAVAHPLELPPHLSTTLVPTAKVCVRLKGLGAEASEDAITALFRTVTPPVVAAVVRLIYRKGAPSGHAYVLFGSEHDCAAAMRAQPDAHAVLAPNASNAPELVCCSLREMLLVCNRPHHIWGPAQ